jgi:hypothetical protein
MKIINEGKFDNQYNQKDSNVQNEKKRFTAFCKELEKLSKKYSIVIQSTGGVSFYDEGSIFGIKYDDDWSSGDLEYKVTTKDN